MKKKSSGVVFFTFANFPGVKIPLLSDEECKARGVEKSGFPPFETWTPEQQAAGRELGESLMNMAIQQAFRMVLRELERMQVERYSEPDFEKEAVRRALAELQSGRWKPGRDDISGVQDLMRTALETMHDEPVRRQRRRRRQSS